MTEAVIFDLDGIVVDTVPLHYRAWKRMFSEYGKDFSFEDYKEKVDGIPRLDGARAVLDSLNEKELENAAERKQVYFRELLDSGDIPQYESTVTLIKKLRRENVPIAVISSSRNCSHILKKIGIYQILNSVVDGNRRLPGKPRPDIFLAAAEETEADPAGCVVFEDALLGVESAKSAGMFVIGVDRYGDPKRLKGADLTISDASEISLEELLSLV